MELTPRQRRAERRARHENSVDMNLVSLIDVFTILIFFLLMNTGVEVLISLSRFNCLSLCRRRRLEKPLW